MGSFLSKIELKIEGNYVRKKDMEHYLIQSVYPEDIGYYIDDMFAFVDELEHAFKSVGAKTTHSILHTDSDNCWLEVEIGQSKVKLMFTFLDSGDVTISVGGDKKEAVFKKIKGLPLEIEQKNLKKWVDAVMSV